MKLLITGAGGQLGCEWVDFCQKNGITFNGFSSSDLDICDVVKIEDKIVNLCPDVIINCAAYTKVDNAEENKELAIEINANAVKNLADLCEKHNIKLVHYSTDYVFAGLKSHKEEFSEGYSEEDYTNPVNVYGFSKLKGEELIKKSDCEYLTLRISWLCGRYGNNFVKTMLKLGSEKKELNVVNDQYGAPTFADQVVEQTFELIQQDKSGIYHLSSDGLISWCQFSKEIFKQKGIDIKVNPISSSEFKTKAKRPYFSKLSTKKISNIERIQILDWKEGLQRLLAQL